MRTDQVFRVDLVVKYHFIKEPPLLTDKLMP